MTNKDSASPEAPDATPSEPKDGELFAERMLSGFGHVSEVPLVQAPRAAEEPYRPLRESTAGSGVTFRLQSHAGALRAHANSPATDVMTDLNRVVAVTTEPGVSVDAAHKTMITHGVRALFVVDESRVVLGIITANDILGERPIQIAQDRGVRHADVLVREVMTPADVLEAMELKDVMQARVGDIVETLKRSGRQHALVIESGSADAAAATRTVRGIFSLTQIVRQLGLPPQVGRDVARTFAEIEAAIGK
jgi:CBS domain-containing protein